MKKHFSKLFVFILILLQLVAPNTVEALIANGANAVNLLGQYNQDYSNLQPIYTRSTANDVPSRFLFESQGMTIDTNNKRFFVSDRARHRILVYNLNADLSFPDYSPDNILGQTDFYTGTAATTQSKLNFPRGLDYDTVNNRLIVADSANHRILIYDLSAGLTDGMNASFVLGQATFLTNTSATTQSGLTTPNHVEYSESNGLLFVSTQGNRVVIYNLADGITNGENAINVLGQTTFTGTASANTQAGLNSNQGIYYNAAQGYLYVTATGNHRVTVYNIGDGITNGENAINVLGQATFTGLNAAATQNTLNGPTAVTGNGNLLYVADSSNNRIMVFDVTAITNGENAVNVLGQSVFTTNASNTTQAGLSFPFGITFVPGLNHLVTSQATVLRASIFDVNAITNGEAAIGLLGQHDQTSFTNPVPAYLKSNAVSRVGFSFNTFSKSTFDTVNKRLFVVDGANNRVLVYNLNADNSLQDYIPDAVLGQSNYFNNIAATTQAGLNAPNDVAYDPTANRLFVSQTTANRVSVFDVATITNGENSINVLGQTTFTGTSSASTQAGMNAPTAVAFEVDRNWLYVVQNHRVTVYNVGDGITNGENAISVLGQPTFTGTSSATSQAGLNGPADLVIDEAGDRLFVADFGSNRVIVYDIATITNGENAINVLGQTVFTVATTGYAQNRTFLPNSIEYDPSSKQLYVGQQARVTVFDVTAISDGENAVNVLGQPNFTSSTASVTQSGLTRPSGLSLVYGPTPLLYVSDSTTHRIMVFDVNTVTAVFYSLTYTPGANGSITGSTSQSVISGGAGTAVTAVPAPGFVFAGWSDGVTTATRTDTNVTNNITVTANFTPQILTMNLSTNVVGFGELSAGTTKYATANTLGSTADSANAHTLQAATNSPTGYWIFIDGTELSCLACSSVINSVGGGPTAPAPNTEQFGLRLITLSGTGSLQSPYGLSNWSYDTVNFPEVIATGTGDNITSEYGVRFMTNIAPTTASGNYNAVITYTITTNF